jgi:hypothetical protein
MRKIFLKTPLCSYLSDVICSQVFPIPYRNEVGTIIPGIKIDGKYSYFYYFKDEYYDSLIDSMLDYYFFNLVNKIETKETWIELLNILRTAEYVSEINEQTHPYYIYKTDE